MKTMQLCQEICTQVPDEVVDAVADSFEHIRGAASICDVREMMAIDLAPRMVREDWRFCPCFPLMRTKGHRRIFDLVHTNMANHLANKVELEMEMALADNRRSSAA
jgi:hypothetical protein